MPVRQKIGIAENRFALAAQGIGLARKGKMPA